MDRGGASIVNVNVWFADRSRESVTRTAKEKTPFADGTPVNAPVAWSNDNPGGSAEPAAHRSGGVPFVAANNCVYACPTSPRGRTVGVVIAIVGAETTIDNVFEAVRLAASATCTSKLKVPASDGVPLITPAEVSVIPGGRDPEPVHA